MGVAYKYFYNIFCGMVSLPVPNPKAQLLKVEVAGIHHTQQMVPFLDSLPQV